MEQMPGMRGQAGSLHTLKNEIELSELIWKSAERALDGWGPWRILKDGLKLRDAIAMAIAEERERCAEIADDYAIDHTAVACPATHACRVADEIAARIRNGGVAR